MTIIDISLPISSNIVSWPNSPGFELEWTQKLEQGAQSNNSLINMDTHLGTHVDAPLHFLPHGASVDTLDLSGLIGPAFVVYLPDANIIDARALEQNKMPANVDRLLLRTKNSDTLKSNDKTFNKDYVGLTHDGAKWLISKGVLLIGLDYLSVASFTECVEIHRELLQARVLILEGLNLFDVNPGEYELICLPLKIVGAEGAPARAILRDR